MFLGHGYAARSLKTRLGNKKPRKTKEIQRQKYVFFDWEHLSARTKWKIKHGTKNMKNIFFSTIFKYKNLGMILLSPYNTQWNCPFDYKKEAKGWIGFI